jgi:hypothetical protein
VTAKDKGEGFGMDCESWGGPFVLLRAIAAIRVVTGTINLTLPSFFSGRKAHRIVEEELFKSMWRSGSTRYMGRLWHP